MSTASSAFAIAAARPSPATAPLCTVVTDQDELDALSPAWQELLKRSVDNQPMLAPTWLVPWWRVYGAGRQLRIGLFHDADRLVGLAPLLSRRCWHHGAVPFRRLEPLGSDVDEGDGVGSDYLGVIAERGAEERVADALAASVVAGRFGAFDEVVIPAMDGDGAMPNLLATAFRDVGLAVDCQTTGAAPYIPLPASWDEYLHQLSGSQRYYLRRSERDFDQWAASSACIDHVRSLDELAEGKRILTALHGERWADAGRTGAFHSPRFAAFHDAELPELLRQNALQLWWLSVRGEPVAALYNIVWDRKVHFYQGGRRPDLPRGVRPGIVLHAHAIRAAIAAGHREYDFLGGESQYKAQLASARRPLIQVRAVRPTLRETLRRLVETAVVKSRHLRARLRNLIKSN